VTRTVFLFVYICDYVRVCSCLCVRRQMMILRAEKKREKGGDKDCVSICLHMRLCACMFVFVRA
jgi:hypothetical protein